MKCIIFLGTQKSGSSYEALSAAKAMGYHIVLLTDNKSHLINQSDFTNVDAMLYCDLNNINSIKSKIDGLKNEWEIVTIISFTERSCHIASMLAKEYGHISFSTEAIGIMLNKLETRKACKRYSGFFREIKQISDLDKNEIEKKCPLILKRLMSSGSRCVVKINDYSEYKNECRGLSNESMLVEEYFNGPQYLIETIVIEGNVKIAAIMKQEISYDYRYIVTGYEFILDYNNEWVQGLITAVEDVVLLTGMETGACHFEFRYVNGNWKLIEANPRISGGVMNLMIQEAYGINLVKETLNLALGLKPDLRIKYKRNIFAQYLTVNREGLLIKTTGRNKASNCEGVLHMRVKPKKGQLLIPPISMGHRYAYVIATGNTSDEAKYNAKHAASQIQFYLKEIDANLLSKFTVRQKNLLNEFYKIKG